jgi:hypothetical protein
MRNQTGTPQKRPEVECWSQDNVSEANITYRFKWVKPGFPLKMSIFRPRIASSFSFVASGLREHELYCTHGRVSVSVLTQWSPPAINRTIESLLACTANHAAEKLTHTTSLPGHVSVLMSRNTTIVLVI